MTDKADLIEAARLGHRISTGYSMHEKELDIGSHNHDGRCIACDGDTDVLECRICGKQWLTACDFDEEYS